MAEQQNEKEVLENEIRELIADGPASRAVEMLTDKFLAHRKSSQTRFKTIFDQSSFGNKIIDANLCITQVNAAMVKLLGYTAEELLGTKITDIAHPDFVQDWKKLQKGLWAEKLTSFSTDTCVIRKDKQVLWCHVTSIIFEDNGNSYGYTIVEDISDRKNLERIRAEVDAKKDEFISIVSHELKTPLTTIKAINQLLQKAVSKDESYYTFITKSNHHILRLEKLITDLFDVTKISEGSAVLNLSTFDLDAILKDCISGLQTIYSSHEIQYHSAGPIRIEADQFRIEQVIINLINNAIKYSPGANKVEVALTSDAEQVKIEVRDYGIGIAKKNVNKIFDRYYRVSESSNHFQGLGLGLYISSQIIEKHKGAFGVDSHLNKGSAIWFTLPLTGVSSKE